MKIDGVDRWEIFTSQAVKKEIRRRFGRRLR